MKITQEVVLDLLPVYLAGEASPDTRALVEEYMKQDEALARRIRLQFAENLSKAAPSALAPDLELRSLRRTRKLIGWQRRLTGIGAGFVMLGLSCQFTFSGGHMTEFHFLMRDFPGPFGACVSIGLTCLMASFIIRRHLRVTAL
jgi:hypothetical protein